MKSEGNEIKDAFELFDVKYGRINAREIRSQCKILASMKKIPVFMKS